MCPFESQSKHECDNICFLFPPLAGTWEQKFPKEMTHYRNFRVNERSSVRVPMMSNKGNYLAAADHELECDVLQVGGENFAELFCLTMTTQLLNVFRPTQCEIWACSDAHKARAPFKAQSLRIEKL